MRTILRNDIEKIDSLLQDGINIHEITEKGRWNYLHRALLSTAKPPAPKIIQHLIDLGVDVNAVDIYGNTPLHYAAKLKNAELIKLLLDAHADINHINEEGISPLRQMLLIGSSGRVLMAIIMLEHLGARELKTSSRELFNLEEVQSKLDIKLSSQHASILEKFNGSIVFYNGAIFKPLQKTPVDSSDGFQSLD